MDSQALEERLKSIESRLLKIEQGSLGVVKPSTSPKPPIASWFSMPVEQITLPTIKTGNWLGIIAVICFVLAAGFILKLSIDSGWLTPVRQIFLATLFGLSLIVSGLFLMNKDREYASFLPAAGIIVFYLTTIAATRWYFFLSFITGIGIVGIVSILCIGLYLRIKHDIYALTASLGAYLSPLILGPNITNVFTIYYYLLCSLTFSIISIGVQSRTLTVISAYLAIGATSLVGLDLQQDRLITILLALHFLIFSLGTFIYSTRNHLVLTSREAWSFFPVLILFYTAEYFYIDRIEPIGAPWISLGFAFILIGLYFWAKKKLTSQSLASLPMILAFITLVFFHSLYLEILPAIARPWMFVLIILFFSFMPAIKNRNYLDTFIVPFIALVIILLIEYINIIFHLIANDTIELNWILVALFGLTSLWILHFKKHEEFLTNAERNYLLLFSAHILAISAFYQITHSYGSLAVSASWLLYGSFVLVLGFHQKDKTMATSALFVLLLAAGKALIYDAAAQATLVRIFCLLLTGAVLYGAGFLVRRMSKWN